MALPILVFRILKRLLHRVHRVLVNPQVIVFFQFFIYFVRLFTYFALGLVIVLLFLCQVRVVFCSLQILRRLAHHIQKFPYRVNRRPVFHELDNLFLYQRRIGQCAIFHRRHRKLSPVRLANLQEIHDFTAISIYHAAYLVHIFPRVRMFHALRSDARHEILIRLFQKSINVLT